MADSPHADIVTFTMNPAIDIFGATDTLFDDSKSRCEKALQQPGGGGINVARNIARMGGDALVVYPAGGPNGALLESLLDEEGTRQLVVKIADHTRQNMAITELSTGKFYHFVFPGPSLTPQEQSACFDTIFSCQPPPRFLVLSGSLPKTVPEDFYGRITKQANQNNTKVILDTSGAALKNSLYQGAWLAKLNRKEFASLGFPEHDSIASLRDNMQTLVERGAVENLIVTLSRGGAVLVARDHEPLFISAPAVTIVSHVGAGDSFVSALTYQLAQGSSLATAFQYGVAAASVTVQTEGNQLTDFEKLERTLQQCKREPFTGR
ncbi:1-phosphofructokinase family hexose kinase [Aliidiomarina halalkaliphila]|uniref:Phosphofructokinase n=1 Tax=Aliidiomarina halalkaliphila TaxID=2593535 RepID=A0A552X4C6_9GAMM|nr:1-phosphofructokinase family hexose kinase [Aliidiomarina halalkaliphila]TRW49884.1 1-phosphofructokinase family hexose kinase [Aliidiomarina halalkaliphila]